MGLRCTVSISAKRLGGKHMRGVRHGAKPRVGARGMGRAEAKGPYALRASRVNVPASRAVQLV